MDKLIKRWEPIGYILVFIGFVSILIFCLPSIQRLPLPFMPFEIYKVPLESTNMIPEHIVQKDMYDLHYLHIEARIRPLFGALLMLFGAVVLGLSSRVQKNHRLKE